MISDSFGNWRYSMLFNMHGAIFVSLCEALKIRPCNKRCTSGLRSKGYSSVRDLVNKLSADVPSVSQLAVQERFLMCLYFSRQNIITCWYEFAHEIIEGPVCEDLRDMFYEWKELRYPRVFTLYRALALALKANPPFTCEQAAFCLEPLEQDLLKNVTEVLYKFLLRSCASVSIVDLCTRKKRMDVQYLRHGEISSFVCLMP